MEESQSSNHATIYILLFICSLFLSVDGLELFRLIDEWNLLHKELSSINFEKCVKYPLIAKTGYTVFSFLAAFSAFLISILICFDLELFVEKFSHSYIKMIYFIFGPYMLTIGLIALNYWDKILFNCDNIRYSRIFSYSNLFNLIVCLSVSFIITVGMLIYEVIVIYMNSIQQRNNGSNFIRKSFWFVVNKYRRINTQDNSI